MTAVVQGALAPPPVTTPPPQPSVLVPLDVLENLTDAADRAGVYHHHKVPDTWPDNTQCKYCSAHTQARILIDGYRR